MSFASMLQGLTRARVRFVVVGGVAAAAHGSARVTNDLEICYDTAPDNIARLAALLAEWDAYPRGVDRGLPFFMDERQLRTTPLMTLTTHEGTSTFSIAWPVSARSRTCSRTRWRSTASMCAFRFSTFPSSFAPSGRRVGRKTLHNCRSSKPSRRCAKKLRKLATQSNARHGNTGMGRTPNPERIVRR